MKTSIYAVTALAAGSNALTMRQDDPHLADFRLYGADGCQDQNLGVWTVVQSDLAASNCTVFDDAVKSVSVTDIVPGCTRDLPPPPFPSIIPRAPSLPLSRQRADCGEPDASLCVRRYGVRGGQAVGCGGGVRGRGEYVGGVVDGVRAVGEDVRLVLGLGDWA